MKSILEKSLLIGIFLCVFSPLGLIAKDYSNITVLIENTETNDGQLFVYLFSSNHQDDFPINTKAAFKLKISKISKKSAIVTFENIPYGKYAIAVHHDENGDGKVNTNFIGMPTENFGASNNAKSFMGPPDFEDAAFEVNKPDVEAKINMD